MLGGIRSLEIEVVGSVENSHMHTDSNGGDSVCAGIFRESIRFECNP